MKPVDVKGDAADVPDLNPAVVEKILNITNGDSAVELMRLADISGEYLGWRDVLHEGPVRAGLSLQVLSQERARFIASSGWGSFPEVDQSFRERNQILSRFREYDRVVLWFEHDLYDQLQILQILNWFGERRTDPVRLSMICTEQYLGHCSPAELSQLVDHETPISTKQIRLAQRAWNDFGSSNPENWGRLLDEDTSVLPFLEGAIERMLEEYPDINTGLSRTAQTSMELLRREPMTGGQLFRLQQQNEQRMFMGDLSYWRVLDELLKSAPPLVALPKSGTAYDPRDSSYLFGLTEAGRDVLNGRRNWMELHRPDRWIGGVHLTRDNLWFWNPDSRKLQQKPG